MRPIMLTMLLVAGVVAVAIGLGGKPQQPNGIASMDTCAQMPNGNVTEKKARHACFAAAARAQRAEKAKVVATTVYTITLYAPSGETKTWQARDMTGMMQGLEFTDMATQHRVRIYGTFTLESNTDQVVETEKDEDNADEE